MCRCSVITASRGKVLRAEPVSALYEQGLVHHVGRFAVLEDQLCAFTTQGYRGEGSPDHADALVFAVTELMLKDNAAILEFYRARAAEHEHPAVQIKAGVITAATTTATTIMAVITTIIMATTIITATIITMTIIMAAITATTIITVATTGTTITADIMAATTVAGTTAAVTIVRLW